MFPVQRSSALTDRIAAEKRIRLSGRMSAQFPALSILRLLRMPFSPAAQNHLAMFPTRRSSALTDLIAAESEDACQGG